MAHGFPSETLLSGVKNIPFSPYLYQSDADNPDYGHLSAMTVTRIFMPYMYSLALRIGIF